MLQRGKFSKKCGRLGGEWEANWVAEGGWEASWAPLGSILSTGRWSRDVCTIIKEVTDSLIKEKALVRAFS